MNKGFTLVELIAVITILALLVIITTPAYDSISKNIKTRNYESKKSTIKSETLKYIEKYLKSEIYSGESDKGKAKCFTVKYLIQSGIISSDSDEEEYILNDITNTQHSGNTVFLKVIYDYKNLKLVALTEGEEKVIDATNNEIFKFDDLHCYDKGKGIYFNSDDDYDNTY